MTGALAVLMWSDALAEVFAGIAAVGAVAATVYRRSPLDTRSARLKNRGPQIARRRRRTRVSCGCAKGSSR